MTEIFSRAIGPDQPPYFVAEIGANHDGSLDRALRLIELAADAGADAVKFQHFQAATIVSRRGFDDLGKQAHQAGWERSVYEVYGDAEVPEHWTKHLSSYAHDHGMAFITTPYSLALADAVEPYVDAYKVGSGDVTYLDLIRHVALKRKPVLLATGASTAEEVATAVGAYLDGTQDPANYGQDLALMQCNTNYTGDPENARYLNLRVLDYWRENYYSLLGLSDHTLGYVSVVAAIAKGACVVEKHFTDDHTRSGPDHGFALEPEQWREMVEAAYDAWSMLGDGEKKVEANEQEARVVQRRALRWSRHAGLGRPVTREDIRVTRPCPEGALEPYRITEVVGKQLARNVQPDTLVRLEDL